MGPQVPDQVLRDLFVRKTTVEMQYASEADYLQCLNQLDQQQKDRQTNQTKDKESA